MAGKCQICGKYSGVYPLCGDCFQLRDEGKVIQCPDCKAWHYKKKKCECKAEKKKFFHKKDNDQEETFEVVKNKSSRLETIPEEKEQNNTIVINENNKSKCITCGKNTSGLLFCKLCYSKYQNKELLFKITNCTNVELLDENYEGRYTCKDGHVVKSKSERDIDNYLFEHNISHAYEKALPYGATEKEVLHPDFFLKDYLGQGEHVYIEHWGYNENNLQYIKTKKFKIPIYEKLKITLICTHEKTDIADIEATLERKLNKNIIKKGKINFE